MTRLLYIDPIGGLAGDMLLAALIDAGAPIDEVRKAVAGVLPGHPPVETETTIRGGLRALRLRPPPKVQGHPRRPAGRPLRGLLAQVGDASIQGAVRERALLILAKLGEAEARVHDVDPNDVELHQLGEDDTLIDVVGIAAALTSLGVEEVLVSAVPLATGGHVLSGHSRIPLPAPAAAELLRGFLVRGDSEGELVTPTAAAVLAALARSAQQFPSIKLDAVGYGAGSRNPSNRPNLVRVFVGLASAAGPADLTEEPDLVLLETNLDDLSPELVADATEALRGAGALDAWTSAIQMKKGRPGMLLAAICRPQQREKLTRVFFETTTTLGVRWTSVRRVELERTSMDVAVGDRNVRLKVGLLDGHVISAKPEHDDLLALAQTTGRPVRAIFDEVLALARAAGLAVEATRPTRLSPPASRADAPLR